MWHGSHTIRMCSGTQAQLGRLQVLEDSPVRRQQPRCQWRQCLSVFVRARWCGCRCWPSQNKIQTHNHPYRFHKSIIKCESLMFNRFSPSACHLSRNVQDKCSCRYMQCCSSCSNSVKALWHYDDWWEQSLTNLTCCVSKQALYSANLHSADLHPCLSQNSGCMALLPLRFVYLLWKWSGHYLVMDWPQYLALLQHTSTSGKLSSSSLKISWFCLESQRYIPISTHTFIMPGMQ